MTALPNFREYLTTASHEASTVSIAGDLLPGPFQPPATHTIQLAPAWTSAQSPLSAEAKGRGSISRQNLSDLAQTVRAGNESWTQLLIHTFGWGWGGTALGPSRLARVLEANDSPMIEGNLANAVGTLDTSGAVAAYWDLNNRSRLHLKHLGPAFFTKFLYFSGAGGPNNAPPPLILDKIVARRICTLISQERRLATGGWTTRDYAFYLALMLRVARHLNIRDDTDQWSPDAVELGIFKPRPFDPADQGDASKS